MLPSIDPSRIKPLQEAARYVMETLGVDYTSETAEHLSVMLEVLCLYQQRSDQYGQLWKESGAVEEFFNGYRKARRMYKRMSAMPEDTEYVPDTDLDDALDAINYLVFGIRNTRAGRLQDKELECPTQMAKSQKKKPTV